MVSKVTAYFSWNFRNYRLPNSFNGILYSTGQSMTRIVYGRVMVTIGANFAGSYFFRRLEIFEGSFICSFANTSLKNCTKNL